MIKEIKVIPNSKKEKIIKSTELIVKVREPAKNGKANKAIIKLLSKYFGKKVRIVSGFKSKKKNIEIY